jgi:hypothetical protein
MHSHCELCRAPLREGDIQLEQQSVTCSSCGRLYGLTRWEAEELQKLRKGASGLHQEVPEENPLPPKPHWTIEREGDVLRLSWSWYRPVVWVVLGMLLLILAGLVPIAAGWREPTNGSSRDAWGSVLVVLVLFGYPSLLSLFNRTHIEASPGTGLMIRHGPLPWHRARTLKTEEIRQLYGQRHQFKNKGRASYMYELRVLLGDGSTRHLIGGGLSAEEVLFLERTLESHLGIEDRPVPGDFKPEGSG